jgi:hypothetical protein
LTVGRRSIKSPPAHTNRRLAMWIFKRLWDGLTGKDTELYNKQQKAVHENSAWDDMSCYKQYSKEEDERQKREIEK